MPAHGVTSTDIKVVRVVVTVEVAVIAAEWFAMDAFRGSEVVYDRPNVVDDLGGSDHVGIPNIWKGGAYMFRLGQCQNEPQSVGLSWTDYS